MKSFLTIGILLACSLGLHAQPDDMDSYPGWLQEKFSEVDSIKVLYEQTQQDTLLYVAEHLLAVAYYYAGDNDLSKVHRLRALRLAQTLGYQDAKLVEYLNLATVSSGTDKSRYLDTALSIFDQPNYPIEKHNPATLQTLTYYLHQRGRSFQAYKLLPHADDSFHGNDPDGNDNANYFYYPILANTVHQSISDTLEAKKWLQVGLSRCLSHPTSTSYQYLADLGSRFQNLGDHAMAIQIFTLGYEQLEKEGRNMLEYGDLLNRFGNAYLNWGQDSIAELFLSKSIASYEAMPNQAEPWHPYGNMARLYLKRNDVEKAAPYIQVYDTMFDAGIINSNSLDYPKALYYYYLEKKDSAQALKYYQEWVRVRKLRENRALGAEINLLTTQEEFELEKAMLQASALRNRQRIIWGIFITAAILLVCLIVTGVTLRNRQQRHAEQLHTDLLLSELKALRAQINPHFIFNALASIQRYVLNHNAEEATNYLAQFSQFIRVALFNADKVVLPLHKELQALRQYLDIEKMRLSNRFDYVLDVDPDVDVAFEIPSMLLQTFAENAIWHGLTPRETADGLISIRVLGTADGMQIILEDNGIGRAEARARDTRKNHHSKGLKMVEDKIKLFNLSKPGLVHYQVTDLYDSHQAARGTRVMIEIKHPTLHATLAPA